MQSPIKIIPQTTLRLADPTRLLEINYKPGEAFQVDFDHVHPHKGNYILQGPSFPLIKFRGGSFRLSAVHIHSAPEHAIDPQEPKHTFEVHFVHIPEAISLAEAKVVDSPKVVIGVLYHDGANKTLGGLSAFGRELKKPSGAKKRSTIPIIPSHFFPMMGKEIDTTNWFHYEGSLTSFPFSGNVSWFVMKTLASVPKKDTAPFHIHAEQEARGLQPLERRLVVRSFKLEGE